MYFTTGFFSLVKDIILLWCYWIFPKCYLSKCSSFFSDIDIPKVTSSDGLTPIENTNYTLSCIIAASNPNPVTKYEWFQNGMKIDYESATFSFDSIKRDNSGNWFCKGIINQSNTIIEKNSNVTKVNVFCKWFSSAKFFTTGQTLWWGTWVLSLMLYLTNLICFHFLP